MRLIFHFWLQSRLRRLLIFSCRIVVTSLPRLLRPASPPRLLSLGGIWSTPWRMTPPFSGAVLFSRLRQPLAGLRRSLDRPLRPLLRRPWPPVVHRLLLRPRLRPSRTLRDASSVSSTIVARLQRTSTVRCHLDDRPRLPRRPRSLRRGLSSPRPGWLFRARPRIHLVVL